MCLPILHIHMFQWRVPGQTCAKTHGSYRTQPRQPRPWSMHIEAAFCDCRLGPLTVCAPSVAQQFLQQAQDLSLMDFTGLGTNSSLLHHQVWHESSPGQLGPIHSLPDFQDSVAQVHGDLQLTLAQTCMQSCPVFLATCSMQLCFWTSRGTSHSMCALPVINYLVFHQTLCSHCSLKFVLSAVQGPTSRDVFPL